MWIRREADAGRETGKTRQASREVTEGDGDREHVYHKRRKGQHGVSVGECRKGDSLLAPSGHPSPEVMTE